MIARLDQVAADVTSSEAPSKTRSEGLTNATIPKTKAKSSARNEQPAQIGPYKILEVLGEGGFGVVYLAEQAAPMRRKVAVKVIKRGMDTRQVITRFQAEEQALAMMNHPGVAKVLDAGETEDGRPYFVMEHVPGVPITDHCDRHRLPINERLELFIDACAAVQHAHQKGVIHRDLKPSNILIAATDSGSIAKVIDFGIAKALSQRLTEDTIFTEQGQIIGTPEYMSPEQADRTAQDIDTRSDVYSLGVLLYELITGERPFELQHVALMEMQRQIVEIDPPKPSTRLSGIGDGTRTAAEKRRTDAKSFMRQVRGDLDWIVMKCLEKDRARRYETASALAEDIRRHLEDEPVQAGPPSAMYRIGKFVRRNRGGVAGAAAIMLILIGGMVGTSWGLAQAIKARDAEAIAKQDALDQAQVASDARDAEAQAKAEVEQRADELEQVVEFQAEQLSGIDVDRMGAQLRRDLLTLARAASERSGTDQAAIDAQASELESLLAGTNFTDLALQTLDENIFRTALVAVDTQFQDQPQVRADLLQTLAVTLREVGLLDLATGPQTEAMEVRRRVLGDEHPDTLVSINRMGFLLQSQGQLEEAEPYLYEALEGNRRVLGDEHPNTLNSVNNVGFLLQLQGRLDEAEPYSREAMEERRRVLGNDHPDTLISINNMGALLRSQGRYAEAEPYYREALDGNREVLGEDHPRTLSSISNLGYLLHSQGRLPEAEPYFLKALEGQRRVLGDEHPRTLNSVSNLCNLLETQQGRLTEAEPYCYEAMNGRRRVLGDEHPNTLTSIANVGFLLQEKGLLREAEPYYREALDGNRRVLGKEHPSTLMLVNNMASLLQRQGRLAEAEPYFRETLDIRRVVLGQEHPDTLISANNMGGLLQTLGRPAEAEPYYREAMEGSQRVNGAEHPHTQIFVKNLCGVLNSGKRFAESETLLRANLPVCERVNGPDHWQTAEVRSRLGEAVAGLERFAESEPLLVESYATLEASLPGSRRVKKLKAAIERLISLYEAWERPEQAAQWRSKLDDLEKGDTAGE